MLNETINQTIQTCNVPSFESVNSMMTEPMIITALIIAWAVPLMLYFIVGCMVHGRSSNGQVTSRAMITYPNFWISVIIFGLIQLGLLVLLVFPVWLKIFEC